MAEEGQTGASREALRRRLAHLMAARLGLSLVVLGVALFVTAAGDSAATERAERGLYTTVVIAFLATIVFAAIHRRVRRVESFGAVQVATDVAIVTALVRFSGGAESIFSFLYLPIAVYAALLLGRGGAYGATAAAALCYGALLATSGPGWLPESEPGSGQQVLRVALWGVHAGALLLVALLASALAQERERAGHALDQRTRALRSLQRLHERTVESLTSGLLTIDPDGVITSFNPEAEQITGRPAGEVLGRALEEVIPGAAELVMEPQLGGDPPVRLRARLRYRSHDDRELHLGLAGSVLRGPEGARGGHVVIFQDVTQVVEMEGELRRQERLAATGALAAHLAHEIRNPLAAISGSVQVLDAMGPSAGEERSRLMQIVVRETDRLNALITDFLQYARPSPAKSEPVVLAAELAELGEMFETVRPDGVALALDVPAGLCVLADGDQLRQLLWNLLLNGVQAMPDGGSLRVLARAVAAQELREGGRRGEGEVPGWVEIAVEDTGTGIPEDVVDRIFDPFFTTKKDGTGLGLATVHRIVEGNGGHLSVESSVGRGTTFRVHLPPAQVGEQ